MTITKRAYSLKYTQLRKPPKKDNVEYKWQYYLPDGKLVEESKDTHAYTQSFKEQCDLQKLYAFTLDSFGLWQDSKITPIPSDPVELDRWVEENSAEVKVVKDGYITLAKSETKKEDKPNESINE